MKKFIKIISSLCIVGLLAGCGSSVKNEKKTENKTDSDTIVTVNGTALSKEKFNYYFYSQQDEILKSAGITSAADIADDFWDKETDGKTNLETAKENALSNLISDALQYQKAKDEGIKLSSSEQSIIDKQIGQAKQNQTVLNQLKQIGVSTETYEQLYTEAMYIQKLIAKYVDEGKINVDKNEALDSFNSSYVKAKHILFMTKNQSTGKDLSDEEKAEKESLANEVLMQIKGGADFDELMNKYCEDPGIKSNPDGYVFTSGEMVQEFEDAAFALQENEVSGIVKTSYGYHIIKRVPLNMEGEAEKQIIENMEYTLAVPEINNLTKEWKSKADIKINNKVYDSVKPTIVKQ